MQANSSAKNRFLWISSLIVLSIIVSEYSVNAQLTPCTMPGYSCPLTSFCNTATGVCSCDSNKDCGQQVCDRTNSVCRACQANSNDCHGQICDSLPGTGNCVQCLTDSDCKSKTPICSSISNNCIGCVLDSDCTGLNLGFKTCITKTGHCQ